MMRTVFGCLMMAAVLAAAPGARADEYPARLIKIVVPYSAGGGADILARILGQKLQEKLGQPTIIENRAGAGGNVGAEMVFVANPDGYTVLLTAQGPLVVNQSLYGKLSYAPDQFEPVSLIVVAYSVLTVNPKVPVNTTQELITFAKANPDRLNYASQGIGTAAHLTAELFDSMTGIKMVHVPYKGSGPALNDLLAGHVDLMFGELAAIDPYIRSGRLRALAVSSKARNASMPDVPTVAETVPGFVVTSWWAMAAPPGTPPAITHKLSAAIADVLRQPDLAARLTEMSMVATGSTPEELALFMKTERERWGEIIRTSGARAE